MYIYVQLFIELGLHCIISLYSYYNILNKKVGLSND